LKKHRGIGKGVLAEVKEALSDYDPELHLGMEIDDDLDIL